MRKRKKLLIVMIRDVASSRSNHPYVTPDVKKHISDQNRQGFCNISNSRSNDEVDIFKVQDIFARLLAFSFSMKVLNIGYYSPSSIMMYIIEIYSNNYALP